MCEHSSSKDATVPMLLHIEGLISVSSVTQFYQEELGQERLRIEQQMQVSGSLYHLVFNTCMHVCLVFSHVIIGFSTMCQNSITFVIAEVQSILLDRLCLPMDKWQIAF